MNKALSVTAGIIGAAELAPIGMLMTEFLWPFNSIAGLVFVLMVPVGAVAGMRIVTMLLSPEDRLQGVPFKDAAVTASVLGILPAWVMTMVVGFAPLEFGLIMLAIVPCIVLFVFLVHFVFRRWL